MTSPKEKAPIIARDNESDGIGNKPSLSSPTHEEIAIAAYQIYLSRGTGEGSEVDDWLQAERELLERSETQTLRSKVASA